MRNTIKKTNEYIIKKGKINEIKNFTTQHKFFEAEKLINDYIVNYNLDCFLQLEQARLLKEEKRNQEAIELLTNLLNNNPKNIGYVLYELGQNYAILEKYPEATYYYEQILNTGHKDQSFAKYELIGIYYYMGEYDKAEKYIKDIIVNNHKSGRFVGESQFFLAKILFKKNHYKEAYSVLDKIVYKDNTILQDNVELYKAKIYKESKNYRDAEKMVEKIIKRNKNAAGVVWLKLLFFKTKNKKMDEATRIYNKIREIYSAEIKDKSKLNFVVAEYFCALEEYEKAKKHYNIVINANKSYVEHSMLGLSFIAVRQHDLPTSYKMNAEIMKKGISYHNNAITNMIGVDLIEGDYKKALEDFKKYTHDFEISYVEELKRIKAIIETRNNFHFAMEPDVSYSINQIYKYDKEKALEHIKEHCYGKNSAIFNPNIDINKLFEEIQDYLTLDNLYEITCFAKYRINYPKIGIQNNTYIDYLDVVAIPYSKEIITMFPLDDYIEQESFEEEVKKEKVIKRESQIDKFNRRYNLKN